jgi:hypothetical protein
MDSAKIILASRESRRVSGIFLAVLVIVFALSTGFTGFNPLAALLAKGDFWKFNLAHYKPP